LRIKQDTLNYLFCMYLFIFSIIQHII